MAELRWRYAMLQELDARLAAGQGHTTLAEVRRDLYERYMALRVAPARQSLPSAAPAGAPQMATASDAPAVRAAEDGALAFAPAVISSAPLAPPAAAPEPPRPAAPAAPPGPVFSWGAFLAEQAIAIMAYLGGFLLLVATLSFEVGGWQVLPNSVKLAAVVIVYVIFGATGLAMFRAPRLRTVSRAYLGVFALMTPLVALAFYRFQLLSVRVLSPSGILCIAALYAAAVYLALGLRTRFATYGYLAWTALIVSALALVPWTGARLDWDATALGMVALVLLVPPLLVRVWPSFAAVAHAATHLCAVASLAAVFAAESLGIHLLPQPGWVAPATSRPSLAAFTVAAVVLVPLALGWSRGLRRAHAPVAPWIGMLADAADVLVAALVAQAVIGATVWLHADRRAVTYALAVLAVVEVGAALTLRRWRGTSGPVRVGIELCATLLAIIAVANAAGSAAPNWPLAAALTAALTVTLGIALGERARWWILGSGLALTWDCHVLAAALVPALQSGPAAPVFFGVLTLALWALALMVGLRAAGRGFATPIYIVALGDACYTSLLLPGRPQPLFQAGMLLTFAVAAFIAARRERQPILGGVIVALFGLATPLPVVIRDANGAHAATLALLLALAALAVRRTHARIWAVGPYVSALMAVVLATGHAVAAGVSTAAWSWLGVPFAAWLPLVAAALAGVAALWEGEAAGMVVPATLMLWGVTITAGFDANGLPTTVLSLALVCAGMAVRRLRTWPWGLAPYAAGAVAIALTVARTSTPGVTAAGWAFLGVAFCVWLLVAFAGLAYIAAAWERVWWGMAAPALLVFWAIGLARGHFADTALVFALAGAGAVTSAWRGRWQGAALHVAAVLGSTLAVFRLGDLGAAAAGWQVALLLAFAATAYLVAVREREPLVTPVASLYAIAAVGLFPSAHGFVGALAMTFGAAALGVVLRLRAGRDWALAAYGVAAAASMFALVRLRPFTPGNEEALLLVFAGAAYVIAMVEAEPLAGLAPALYAWLAIALQPDAHALLPLALGLAVLGMLVGRAAGVRASWSIYAGALAAALATALLGQSDPTFEATALLFLALATYAIAAVESRPDILPAALVLGVLAAVAAASAGHFADWQTTLLFIALAWVSYGGRFVWAALPVRQRGFAWWAFRPAGAELGGQWADPRMAGGEVHRWGGLLVASGAVLFAVAAPDAFAPHAAQTQAVALALLALGAMLALVGREPALRLTRYVAGLIVAVAITWEARWLGAQNILAFVLAPGSYLLLIGAYLPADEELGYPLLLGQVGSLIGALMLLLPAVAQSFDAQRDWFYVLVLALEALVIAGLGVGTRSRTLVLVGSCFVGLAALRGAVLAVNSGVPVALVIALVALMLLIGATWLSLRSRHEADRA